MIDKLQLPMCFETMLIEKIGVMNRTPKVRQKKSNFWGVFK